jgi:hypothetical protein
VFRCRPSACPKARPATPHGGGGRQTLLVASCDPATLERPDENSDTPYSFLWMDVRAEPLVVTMPAIAVTWKKPPLEPVQ